MRLLQLVAGLAAVLHGVPLVYERAQDDWSQVEATKVLEYQIYGNKSAIRYPFEFHSLQTIQHQNQMHLVVGGKNGFVVFKGGNLERSNEFLHISNKDSKNRCDRLTLSYCVNYITAIMDVGTNVTLCGTNSNDPQLFSIEKKNLFDDVWYQKHWGDNIADISQAYSNRACPSIPCLTSFHVPLPQSNQLFMATAARRTSIKADLIGSYTLEVRSSRERHTDLLNNPKFTFGTEYGDHIVLFFREDNPSDDSSATIPDVTVKSSWPDRKQEVARIGFICKETADLDTLIKVTLRCQIGDRQFPTLIAAKRIKGQNQIYGLFASKEETLRHSAVCVYDLADISRQMRDAEYLENGKGQAWPPSSLPDARHPFTCSHINDDSRGWLRENSHFAPVITSEAVLVAPPHKFGYFTTMMLDQIDGQIPVLFFGTNKGHVVKVGAFKSSEAIESGRHYSHEKGNHAQSFEYRLIEAVNVTQFTSSCDCNKDSCTEAPCEVVKELKLFQKDQSATKDIIVGFNNCMVKIPVATCQRDISCCDSDPYCHQESSKCIPMNSSRLKARLRLFKQCPIEGNESMPCAVGNMNSYDCQNAVKKSLAKLSPAQRADLKKVKSVLSSVKGLPKSDLIKPAMIAAAEIVLHRKQDQSLDETLPIALQTSQMAVYPELVFQVSILRDKIDKLVTPNNDFKQCHNRLCGHQEFHSPLSRQIWPWMAQLLQAFSAKCDEVENAHVGNSRYNLCKKQNCHFAHVADIHTLFRETTKHMNKSLANDFDWMPRFQYLPFEIDNTTRPFRFDFDPIKQMVTVGFHYSVDFCQLIGNPTEKYRSVKKASQTLPSVQKALTTLAHQIKYKMETTECHQKTRKRSYESQPSPPRCKAQLCDQISFASNVTSTLADHEFEQFISLFASHSECGQNHRSLNIGTRRKLNKIFGREASKLLTIEPKSGTNECKSSVIASTLESKDHSKEKPFRISFAGSSKEINVSFWNKQKNRKRLS